MVKVCNRLDDCLDNSDEKGCGMCRFIYIVLFNLKGLGSFKKKKELLRQLLNYNHIYSMVVSEG